MTRLYDITPFTLLDYPGELACIAWFAGCNLRCVYCHNPDIVLARGGRTESELISFLEKRRGQLTAVVFSGGEATLCPSLLDLAKKAKKLGYKVKLDTNGTRPTLLVELIEAGVLDYVALDYKCGASRAKELLGTAKYQNPFRKSLVSLIDYAKRGLTLDVRTTYHADLMSEAELGEIIEDLDSLGYQGVYTIQNIVSTGDKTLGNISKPLRRFDPLLLPKPQNFEVTFRNFCKRLL